MTTVTLINPWSKAPVYYDLSDEEHCQHDLDNIVASMDDDLREELHAELAPCSAGEFLKAWIERVGIDEASAALLS